MADQPTTEDVEVVFAERNALLKRNGLLEDQLALMQEGVKFATLMLGDRAASFWQFCGLVKERDHLRADNARLRTAITNALESAKDEDCWRYRGTDEPKEWYGILVEVLEPTTETATATNDTGN